MSASVGLRSARGLLTPTARLVLAWLSDPAGSDAASRALFTVALVVTVVCLPFIVWILVSVINPDFRDLPVANRGAVIASVLVFALAGFGIGPGDDLVLNWDDFEVSGTDLAANCVAVSATLEPG